VPVRSAPTILTRARLLLKGLVGPFLRFWRSPAVPLVVLMLSILGVVATARTGVRVVDTNLPTPRVTEHQDPLAEAHPTFTTGSAYRIEASATSRSAQPPGARLYLQLWTEGRSRLLVVRQLVRVGSQSVAGSLFPGKFSVQVVPHLGWIDVGEIPEGSGACVASIRSFSETSFGFTSVNVSSKNAGLQVDVSDLTDPSAAVNAGSLRYRVAVDAPVSLRDSLARLFFFPSTGWVLPLAALLALVALLASWVLLDSKRTCAATSSLSAAVLLLHAALLPPLMGGDETGHAPAIEIRVIPGPSELGLYYPSSVARFAAVLDMERVQYRSDEALPVSTLEERDRMKELMGSSLVSAARKAGPAPPLSSTVEGGSRAPAYYGLVARLCRPFASAAILDRISSYRLAGVALVICLVALACGLLHGVGAGAWNMITIGTVALIPYMVAGVASTSNYSPAIGFGLLGAAGLVGGVLGRSPGRRVASLLAGLLAFAIGIPFWSDFALGIAVLAPLLPLLLVLAFANPRAGPGPVGLTASGAVLAAAVVSAAVFSDSLVKIVVGLPRAMIALEALRRPDVQARLPYALSPLVLLLGGLLYIRFASSVSKRSARVLAWALSGLLAVALIGGFLALPYTQIPYGYVQPPRTEQLGLFLRSMVSNSFSWDQDFFGWKLWWGVFGWVDTPSHPLVYAISRWSLSLAIIASPVLALPFVRRRPQQAAMLLTVICFALCAIAVSFLIRLNGPVLPYGRYFLPFLPLVLLPLLALFQAPGRIGKLRAVFAVAVLFHIWTAVYTLGTRYYLGSW
jgi:hypothetical protein